MGWNRQLGFDWAPPPRSRFMRKVDKHVTKCHGCEGTPIAVWIRGYPLCAGCAPPLGEEENFQVENLKVHRRGCCVPQG